MMNKYDFDKEKEKETFILGKRSKFIVNTNHDMY